MSHITALLFFEMLDIPGWIIGRGVFALHQIIGEVLILTACWDPYELIMLTVRNAVVLVQRVCLKKGWTHLFEVMRGAAQLNYHLR